MQCLLAHLQGTMISLLITFLAEVSAPIKSQEPPSKWYWTVDALCSNGARALLYSTILKFLQNSL